MVSKILLQAATDDELVKKCKDEVNHTSLFLKSQRNNG